MANSSVCYTISNDIVYSYNQLVACGASDTTGATAQSCCYAEDYCMADGICHFTTLGAVNATGYYMAGCTDPTWKDPACPRQCSAEYTGDIIYNRAESYWNCCHSEANYLNCQEPSDYIVRAPAPLVLSTVAHLTTAAPSSTAISNVGTVTISHSAVASSATPSVGASSPSNPGSGAGSSMPAKSSSGGLSTGAKVGIAIAALAGVALIFGAAFLFYRRNKRRHQDFKHFNDNDSRYSNCNRSHHTLPSLHSFRRDTYDTATTQATRANTNRNTVTTTRSAVFPTNRNTYASSHYTEGPRSPAGLPQSLPQSPAPAQHLPEGADGIQVVKQLPRTPEEHIFAQNRKKTEVENEQGPFEMHNEEIEMQTRQRPVTMQELEGTTVVPAELDARSMRTSVGSQLTPSVRRMQDEELEEEMRMAGRDVEESSTQQLRPGSGQSRRDET